MKKVVGIIVVVAVAVAMFVNTNTAKDTNTDLSLANLVSLNTASADCEIWSWPQQCNAFNRCSSFGSGGGCDAR